MKIRRIGRGEKRTIANIRPFPSSTTKINRHTGLGVTSIQMLCSRLISVDCLVAASAKRIQLCWSHPPLYALVHASIEARCPGGRKKIKPAMSHENASLAQRSSVSTPWRAVCGSPATPAWRWGLDFG